MAEQSTPSILRKSSAVMVAEAGAETGCCRVTHGAGRAVGRDTAKRTLVQSEIEKSFDERDILTNWRHYPVDEAPDAYKNFGEVLRSVELAGLATSVTKLLARFVIRDSDESLKGAA